MAIIVDSPEYKCWHEVGHAALCLHLGGEVFLVEFLPDGDPRGHARTSTEVTPEIHRTVACGGFAAEFFLLNNGLAQQDAADDRDVSQVVFHNATHDREAFWDRRLGKDQYFSEQEDRVFMNHALNVALPILDLYLAGMTALVAELKTCRAVNGHRVRQLLHGATLRR